jgi:hypothetical protein
VIFNISASFGGADRIYKSKPDLIQQVDTAIHGLNMALGYKISGTLPLKITQALEALDTRWQRQVPSELKRRSRLPHTSGKSVDLRHPEFKVDIEIERGNVGSFYRDIFKFNIHHQLGIIDLGILITSNRELSLALGENIAWSGRCEDELFISWDCGANNNCPVLLLELVPDSYPEGRSLLDVEARARLTALQQSRRGGRSRYPQWRGERDD